MREFQLDLYFAKLEDDDATIC